MWLFPWGFVVVALVCFGFLTSIFDRSRRKALGDLEHQSFTTAGCILVLHDIMSACLYHCTHVMAVHLILIKHKVMREIINSVIDCFQ